jgi:hypothetical protein
LVISYIPLSRNKEKKTITEMQYPFLSTGQLYRNSEIPSYKPVKKNA